MGKVIAVKTKPAIKSKTIIGGILAFLPLASEVASHLASTPFIPPHVAAIIGSVGGALAIAGRWAAKADIKGLLFERR